MAGNELSLRCLFILAELHANVIHFEQEFVSPEKRSALDQALSKVSANCRNGSHTVKTAKPCRQAASTLPRVRGEEGFFLDSHARQ